MKKITTLLLLLLYFFAVDSADAQQLCNAVYSYTVDPIAYVPVVPYYAGTQVPVVADTFSTAIPIGFDFNFYGVYFSSLLISPNGFLTFDTSRASGWGVNSMDIPNTISLFEQEHEISPWVSGSVSYSTLGTAPNRMFVVSYDSVYISSFSVDSSRCTGQVVLYESTGVIEMYIGFAESLYSGMIQGITGSNYNITAGVAGRDTMSHWTATNDGQRFTLHATNTPYPALAPICMVTVDSASSKNMIVWDKSTTGVAIDSFVIYKETNVSGVYAVAGAQAYATYSTFIDTGSNPAQQANRYELGFRDSCGLLAAVSDHHKTIHLTISQGIGNTWNLAWDAYEGVSYGSYNLYRGTSPSTMGFLTSIPSTLYSYTDLNPPVGNVYYVIGIDVSGGCNPTARISSFSSTLSNIVSNPVTGFPAVIDVSSLAVFPNPVRLAVNLKLKLNAKTDLDIVMSDVTGRVVYSEVYKDVSDLFEQKIDCSALSRGVYFVEIKAGEGSVNKRIVVE